MNWAGEKKSAVMKSKPLYLIDCAVGKELIRIELDKLAEEVHLLREESKRGEQKDSS